MIELAHPALSAKMRAVASFAGEFTPVSLVAISVPLALFAFIGWTSSWSTVAGVSAQSSQVLAADGQVIATLHGEENRTIVPLDKISKHLSQAVVATEDRGFYQHSGVSLRGIVRAAKANLEGKTVVQGGSTITQQYVRNAFPSVGTQRTLVRKLKESFLALRVEQEASKEEILDKYLNLVYFGRGAYGAEAAARTYFKVPASDLTVGQAAYLAGIIRSPERYQIASNPEGAERLRNRVLDDMVNAGNLTKAQADLARTEDLVQQFKPGQSIEVESPRAGFFVEYVRQILRRDFHLSDEQILAGGLKIQTTLDLGMQDAAEAAVSSVLNRPTDPEAALVSMDTQGRVRAMVGGRDTGSITRARGFNFAVDANQTGGGRPAGSAFKVIALAALVDEGKSISSTFSGPSKLLIDSPECRNKDGTPWEVSNFGNAGFGSLDVNQATIHSVNTIYAQIMESAVSPQSFMSMAARLGIEIPQYDAGCALTLGTTDVTPMEMARAYTTFAARGMRPDPLVVERITTSSGKVIAERSPHSQEVISPNTADTVNYVLQNNVKQGTGTGAQIGRPAAGKTGTTQNHENAWFAGYTPELTTVVWMGFAPSPDGTIPLMKNVRGKDVTGGSFPATIWKKFMTKAVAGTEESKFVKPKLGGELVHSKRVVESSTDPMEGLEGEEEEGVISSDQPPAELFPSVSTGEERCGLLRRCQPSEDSGSKKDKEPSTKPPSAAQQMIDEVQRQISANR